MNINLRTLSVCLSVSLPLSLCVSLCLFLSLYVSVSTLSVCLFLSVCLSLSLRPSLSFILHSCLIISRCKAMDSIISLVIAQTNILSTHPSPAPIISTLSFSLSFPQNRGGERKEKKNSLFLFLSPSLLPTRQKNEIDADSSRRGTSRWKTIDCIKSTFPF